MPHSSILTTSRKTEPALTVSLFDDSIVLTLILALRSVVKTFHKICLDAESATDCRLNELASSRIILILDSGEVAEDRASSSSASSRASNEVSYDSTFCERRESRKWSNAEERCPVSLPGLLDGVSNTSNNRSSDRVSRFSMNGTRPTLCTAAGNTKPSLLYACCRSLAVAGLSR